MSLEAFKALEGHDPMLLPTPPNFFSVPAQAVGASLVYFDVWNAGAAPLLLQSLKIIKDGSAAITGVIAVKLFLTRTSAIGTGGTAAVIEGTDPAVMSFSRGIPLYSVDAGVTGRLTPSGGATAGAVISERQIYGEETSAISYGPPWPDFVDVGNGLVIPTGSGIRVIQGTVAATGNIGFSGTFTPVLT